MLTRSVVLLSSLVVLLCVFVVQSKEVDEFLDGDEGDNVEIKHFTVEGKVRLRLQLTNGTIYEPPFSPQQRKGIHAEMVLLLTGNQVNYRTLVRQGGSFVFTGVLPGPYSLTVSSKHFMFEPLRVDVSKKQNGKVKVKKFIDKKALPYPIQLNPVATVSYFEPERQFDLLAYILGNKMILMFGGMTLLMFVMTKITPDLKDLQESGEGGNASGNNANAKKNTPEQMLASGLLPAANKAK